MTTQMTTMTTTTMKTNVSPNVFKKNRLFNDSMLNCDLVLDFAFANIFVDFSFIPSMIRFDWWFPQHTSTRHRSPLDTAHWPSDFENDTFFPESTIFFSSLFFCRLNKIEAELNEKEMSRKYKKKKQRKPHSALRFNLDLHEPNDPTTEGESECC